MVTFFRISIQTSRHGAEAFDLPAGECFTRDEAEAAAARRVAQVERQFPGDTVWSRVQFQAEAAA